MLLFLDDSGGGNQFGLWLFGGWDVETAVERGEVVHRKGIS